MWTSFRTYLKLEVPVVSFTTTTEHDKRTKEIGSGAETGQRSKEREDLKPIYLNAAETGSHKQF